MFPIPETSLVDPYLVDLGEKYLEDLQRNSTTLVRMQKQTGRTETQSFKIQKSKPIIDEIIARLPSTTASLTKSWISSSTTTSSTAWGGPVETRKRSNPHAAHL